jgi:hypothetical protein
VDAYGDVRSNNGIPKYFVFVRVQVQLQPRRRTITSTSISHHPSFHVLRFAPSRHYKIPNIPYPRPYPESPNPSPPTGSLASVNSVIAFLLETEESRIPRRKATSTNVASSVTALDHGLHVLLIPDSGWGRPAINWQKFKQPDFGSKPEQQTATFLLPGHSERIVRSRSRSHIRKGRHGR